MPLPPIVAPGEVIGTNFKDSSKQVVLNRELFVGKGATDSNAAFYASGAGKIGDWSTTIGTTLAVKGISNGYLILKVGSIVIVIHDGNWMPGGASNAGGEILKASLRSYRSAGKRDFMQSGPLRACTPLFAKVNIPFLIPFLPLANKGDFAQMNIFWAAGFGFCRKNDLRIVGKARSRG